jgi:Encapsulating protein for peroxidase
LATRAANLLAQGEDLLINQGNDAVKHNSLFTEGRIHTRAGPGPVGLVNRESLSDGKDQVLDVEFTNAKEQRYGEETFGVVERAYARLQGLGHYGPYALVLPPGPNADTRAPLKTTLIMPADRIASLVDGRFYGTGTLPEIPELLGLMLSWGGNTIDLVVGRDATTAFLQEDSEGLYRFRVFERFALRDKDPTSRFLLKFEKPAAKTDSR